MKLTESITIISIFVVLLFNVSCSKTGKVKGDKNRQSICVNVSSNLCDSAKKLVHSESLLGLKIVSVELTSSNELMVKSSDRDADGVGAEEFFLLAIDLESDTAEQVIDSYVTLYDPYK